MLPRRLQASTWRFNPLISAGSSGVYERDPRLQLHGHLSLVFSFRALQRLGAGGFGTPEACRLHL